MQIKVIFICCVWNLKFSLLLQWKCNRRLSLPLRVKSNLFIVFRIKASPKAVCGILNQHNLSIKQEKHNTNSSNASKQTTFTSTFILMGFLGFFKTCLFSITQQAHFDRIEFTNPSKSLLLSQNTFKSLQINVTQHFFERPCEGEHVSLIDVLKSRHFYIRSLMADPSNLHVFSQRGDMSHQPSIFCLSHSWILNVALPK